MLFTDAHPGWIKALERAHDPKAHKHPLRIKHISGNPLTSDRLGYLVTSGETGKFDYGVSIDFTPDGIDGRCGCLAQKHGLVCDHLAYALETAGLLSLDGELVSA